jgi:hypothetical protein
LRWLAVIVALALTIGGWLWWRQDPRMKPDAAARALQARLQTDYRFSCKPTKNDGSIEGIGDVDYLCQPVGRPALSGYWIGTDAHQITAVEPTG